MPSRVVDRTALDRFCTMINSVSRRVQKLENKRSVVLPSYDAAHFPANAVEGEVAHVGSLIYKYHNGAWVPTSSTGGDGGGGTASPVLVDYFSNSSNPPFEPYNYSFPSGMATAPHPGALNYVHWEEQANWTGYPDPIIAVDKLSTGNDPAGVPLSHRFVYCPSSMIPGKWMLVEVMFSLWIPDWLDDKWIDVNVIRRSGAPGVGWTANSSSSTNMTYGYRSDFPVNTHAAFVAKDWSDVRPQASLTFWDQIGGTTQPYTGYAFQVYQSFPSGVADNDWDSRIFCELIFKILKTDAFEGGVF